MPLLQKYLRDHYEAVEDRNARVNKRVLLSEVKSYVGREEITANLLSRAIGECFGSVVEKGGYR